MKYIQGMQMAEYKQQMELKEKEKIQKWIKQATKEARDEQ